MFAIFSYLSTSAASKSGQNSFLKCLLIMKNKGLMFMEDLCTSNFSLKCYNNVLLWNFMCKQPSRKNWPFLCGHYSQHFLYCVIIFNLFKYS